MSKSFSDSNVMELSQAAQKLLSSVNASSNVSLLEVAKNRALLVVFLRHKGCTFCRETMSRLNSLKALIEQKNVLPVIVHMSEPDIGEDFVKSYGLTDFVAISDPEKKFYRAFQVPRGGLSQLFGLKVLKRGLLDGLLATHGIGFLDGDGLQMPGLFLLVNGQIEKSFIYQSIGDVPPIEDFLRSVNP